MRKFSLKIILLIIAASALSVGAVFALNLSGAGSEADTVAVLKTRGMTCGSCAGRIERALGKKAGVVSVEADVDAGRVYIAYDSKVAKPEALAETVTGIGYGSSILQTLSAQEYRAQTGRDQGVKTAKTGCACCNK